ncbi:unnamed protein product [Heligmosomoides polygyrus]|uniref:Phlebovirus_G2 domain-containing protein n=1 Tax=Heligmosomoides polygyrus TaxID=6339 RepID=A0A183GXM5_HELPZ|nr:unnamed protein product [Heligmosomoides polygyrus]
MVNIFDLSMTVCSTGGKKTCNVQHSLIPSRHMHASDFRRMKQRYTSFNSGQDPLCPHSGSCTFEKCAAVNSSSLIPELEKGNRFPGNTACVESCGGPGCDCFYLSSGCLFYRIYLELLTTKIFKIFHCSRWTEEAKMEVTHYDAINRKSSTLVTYLSSNIPATWKTFSFTSHRLRSLPFLCSILNF